MRVHQSHNLGIAHSTLQSGSIFSVNFPPSTFSLSEEKTPKVFILLVHTGFFLGQTAWSRGLPGVLSFHIGEEHPQYFPYCSFSLHEQTPACKQTQPCPPPVQETPTPAQQDRAPFLHLQQGQV